MASRNVNVHNLTKIARCFSQKSAEQGNSNIENVG